MENQKYPKLKNPPIKEVVFSLAFPEFFTVDELKRIGNGAFFVEKKFVTLDQNLPQIDNVKLVDKAQGGYFQSYIYKSPTLPGRVIRVANSLVLYHNIGKYAGWEELSNEFKQLITDIQNVKPNVIISNIGLRYVNHIQLPKPQDLELEKYLTVLPCIPDSLKNETKGYAIQLGLVRKYSDTIILNGSLSQNVIDVDTHFATFAVDINLGVASALADGYVKLKSLQEMETILENLRTFKNDIFYSALTDETVSFMNN